MVQSFRLASRLAALALMVGVSSAFGAIYTFDLTSSTRLTSTVGGGIVIASNEDSNITVTLTALATTSHDPSVVVVNSAGAGVDDGNGGGSVGEDNIEGGAGAETLVITPTLGSPFTATVQSVTFTNTELTGGGDDATIFLDQLATESFDIPIGDASGTYVWNVPANTFSTFIAFDNSDGNDDYQISQIILDIDTAAVPEPATWTLFGFGVAALAWFRRKRS